MNQIKKIREEIASNFDPRQLVEGSSECFVSPSKKYRLETANYHQNKKGMNWDVTKVEVYDSQSQEKIFKFFGNDGRFFHEWLTKDKIEYLICAEDLFGGQTVIDLSNKKMASYSRDEDGFIWTEFHLSTDRNKLAVIGCYWGAPYVLRVYDFQHPLSLPLVELNEIDLIDNAEVIEGWLDNETLVSDKRNISVE